MICNGHFWTNFGTSMDKESLFALKLIIDKYLLELDVDNGTNDGDDLALG